MEQCRFCLDYGSNLVAPCACTGTGRYVHRTCLRRWAELAPRNALSCPVCNANYRVNALELVPGTLNLLNNCTLIGFTAHGLLYVIGGTRHDAVILYSVLDLLFTYAFLVNFRAGPDYAKKMLNSYAPLFLFYYVYSLHYIYQRDDITQCFFSYLAIHSIWRQHLRANAH